MTARYTEWLNNNFTNYKILPLGEVISMSSAVDNLRMISADTQCRILDMKKVNSPIVNSKDYMFFELIEGFSCSSSKAIIEDGDVIYDMIDPSVVTIFHDDCNVQTFAPEGSMILRPKCKCTSQFLAWFIGLEEVYLEIMSSFYLKEWSIEVLPIPYSDNFKNKTFQKLLGDTSSAENRIARNSAVMIARLKRIREDVVNEISDMKVPNNPTKK